MNNNKWNELADEKSIENAKKSLESNGIKVLITKDSKEAFKKALELIPENSEVMDVPSMTLEKIGLSKEIQESGRYVSINKKIASTDNKEMRDTMRRHSIAPEYAIGSVHAVTEDGKILIASNTGSQLAPYAYGAKKIIWVVGTQKIVKNFDDAFKRIYEHSFPLENERAKKAYGIESNVSKILIVEKEITPDRITIIFVKEVLGF